MICTSIASGSLEPRLLEVKRCLKMFKDVQLVEETGSKSFGALYIAKRQVWCEHS